MLSSADASAHEFILDLLPTKGIKVNSRRQRKVKRAKNGRPRVLKGRVAPEPIPSVLRHTSEFVKTPRQVERHLGDRKREFLALDPLALEQREQAETEYHHAHGNTEPLSDWVDPAVPGDLHALGQTEPEEIDYR